MGAAEYSEAESVPTASVIEMISGVCEGDDSSRPLDGFEPGVKMEGGEGTISELLSVASRLLEGFNNVPGVEVEAAAAVSDWLSAGVVIEKLIVSDA